MLPQGYFLTEQVCGMVLFLVTLLGREALEKCCATWCHAIDASTSRRQEEGLHQLWSTVHFDNGRTAVEQPLASRVSKPEVVEETLRKITRASKCF